MSSAARLSLVDRADPHLSIVAQCGLLKVARSTLYYRPAPVSMDDLRLMRQIDEQYLTTPFYGSRRMVAVLRRDGEAVNRKHVRRLMQVMGIEAIYQKPNTSRRHLEHKVYPYLLRGLAIDRPNRVWCADITYVPLAKGSVYLVAVPDWFSQRVLAWRLSISMETEFVSKRCRMRRIGMASQASSIPIKACSSPARLSSTNWRAAVSVSAWTARGGFTTTSSSSGCGTA